MRIIAGDWRGRVLTAPPGLATRPTADRARETLFNMLASRIGSFDGLKVADLFAGSGALGFEALSRGAASCLFMDRDPAAQKAIQANAARLGCAERIAVRASLAALPGDGFDLIFADPPYDSDLAAPTVAALVERSLLSPGGWLCVETARRSAVEPQGLTAEAMREVGRARLTLLRRP